MEIQTADIATKNLNHLGLVAGMIDELGLVAEIDRHIPNNRKVSLGVMVKALILNAMGFSQHALYITPKFFERCPVEQLLGASYVAADFNDDSIGRCLDELFDYGLSNLFVKLSHEACRLSGISSKFWHIDSTNFSVEGNYDDEQDAVKLRHGHAKDKRFDLKQITLGLITTYKSAIPRYMQTFDGNASDKQTLVAMIEKFVSCFEKGADIGIMIADSGVYSAENMVKLKEIDWITRVPETSTEAKEAIKKTTTEELINFANTPGYGYKSINSQYGGIAQRWLVVQSAAQIAAATKTVNAKATKEIAACQKALEKKSNEKFVNLDELSSFVADVQKKYPLVAIQYTTKEKEYYCKQGKPKEENKRIAQQLATITTTTKVAAVEEMITQKSRFILATNILDTKKLSDEEVLLAYKLQATSVEKGFKFLKDPIFFAESFFVKKPSRLEGLLMIMTLSLLVYSLLERKLQNALVQKDETIINQIGKEAKKPTIRLVFTLFRGIHFVTIKGQYSFCNNLDDNHKKIIRLLGHHIAKYYLIDQ